MKRIKIAREHNKKLLQDDVKELICFILSDIAKLPDNKNLNEALIFFIPK